VIFHNVVGRVSQGRACALTAIGVNSAQHSSQKEVPVNNIFLSLLMQDSRLTRALALIGQP